MNIRVSFRYTYLVKIVTAKLKYPISEKQSDGWFWQESSGGHVPGNAVHGGKDINGETLYVGRVVHGHDTLPGKINPSHGVCYVAFGGDEHAYDCYQVLCSNREMKWEKAHSGDIKKRTIVGGRTKTGEPLYIGRAWHAGSLIIGKIHLSHGVLYFPFDGKEFKTHDYEVLRHKK
jgi:hypothetical protein